MGLTLRRETPYPFDDFRIQWTSSVTITVIGEVKMVILLALSALLLDEAKVWTAKMSIGFVLALMGFMAYSHVRLSLAAHRHSVQREKDSEGEDAPVLQRESNVRSF